MGRGCARASCVAARLTVADVSPPRQLRVLVAGGGTAGHVEPAMALADALVRRLPTAEVTALGTEYGLEATLVPARGYPIHMIPRVAMPRRLTLGIASLPPRMVKAVRATSAVLDATRPDVVVGFGGYVSLPAYLAARRARIAIVVHEANAKPGLANRVGARLTQHVAVSSSMAKLPHGQLIGVPLRRAIATLDRAATRAEARSRFGLDEERPTLLVFGGSQGAQSVNEALTAALPDLREAGIQVLHAVGPGNQSMSRSTQPRSTQPPVNPVPVNPVPVNPVPVNPGVDGRPGSNVSATVCGGSLHRRHALGIRGRRCRAMPFRRDDLRWAGGRGAPGSLRALPA